MARSVRRWNRESMLDALIMFSHASWRTVIAPKIGSVPILRAVPGLSTRSFCTRGPVSQANRNADRERLARSLSTEISRRDRCDFR
jgi:hypothetical protein